ncbi:F-box protein SKIP23-like [Tripterygium wilfordii]|uniref:F-box protein SKIP23-like n=1 Tax=Tripterygium wilfordii TaxID=458696 RepID=UPI0018F801CD|nr:F-box protein SKIP23-like [Tripterygium wilfordii]
MYHNELLYAVDIYCEIMVCNLKSDPPTVSIIKMQRIPSEVFLCDEMYLVGSADELFLVMRFLDSRYDSDFRLSHRTRRFDVLRIDRSEQLAQWNVVTDVGERAFFVGQNESVYFMASEYRECMGNCIYFTSNADRMTFNDHLGEYDAGIYKLSDGTIESLPPCPRNLWPPPIWVTPNPY